MKLTYLYFSLNGLFHENFQCAIRSVHNLFYWKSVVPLSISYIYSIFQTFWYDSIQNLAWERLHFLLILKRFDFFLVFWNVWMFWMFLKRSYKMMCPLTTSMELNIWTFRCIKEEFFISIIVLSFILLEVLKHTRSNMYKMNN